MLKAILLIAAVALVAASVRHNKRAEDLTKVVSGRSHLYTWTRHPGLWSDVGASKPDETMKIAIHLPNPREEELKQLWFEITDPEHPKYRKFLAEEDILEMSKPEAHVTEAVMKWLNIDPSVKITQQGEAVLVEAPVKMIEKLFATKIHTFRHMKTHKSVKRHVGTTSVPQEVAKHVLLVEGLHAFPPVNKNQVKRMGGVGQGSTYQVPQTFWARYGYPANGIQLSHGSTAGIFAQYSADGAPLLSDLQAYDSDNGLPQQTFIYNGEADQTVGIEATLDVQMLTTMALGVNLTFFMQQDWMYMFTQTLLGQGKYCPYVVSISYGWSEYRECGDTVHDQQVCQAHGWSNLQYIQATEAQFVKLGLRGTTIVASSGDTGAPGIDNYACQNATYPLNPIYPAASAYVLSVGGTYVNPTNTLQFKKRAAEQTYPPNSPCNGMYSCTPATGWDETACTLDNSGYTTGGGFSHFIPMPKHQAKTVLAYLQSGVQLPPSQYFNVTNRAHPDTSALGENVLIFAQGAWEPVGGTSCSAPLTAGIIATLNDYLFSKGKAPLGPVAPLFYKAATGSNTFFHQVSQGNNACTEECCASYGYNCNSAGGWSPVNGLGTPKYPNLLNLIKSLN